MIQSTRYKKGNAVMYNGMQMWVYSSARHPNYILSQVEDLNKAEASQLSEAFLSDLKPSKSFGTSTIKSKSKAKTKAEIAQENAQRIWFEMQINKIPEFCQECNAPLRSNLYSNHERKCVIAHCLPKKEKMFPELAIHPDNVLFLGAKCGCHNRADFMGLDTRMKMKVYPLMIEKYNKMKKKLSPEQQQKARKYLGLEK